MDTVQSARWEMIEAGGRTAQSFGLNRLFGQIYMALYLSEDALCLDEVAAQLGVSKASVSIACRQMTAWGALQSVWRKGDRKDYYMAETDFHSILSHGFLASLTKKLDSAKVQIERSLSLLDGSSTNGARVDFLKRRLKEADSYRQKVSRLLSNPIIRRLIG